MMIEDNSLNKKIKYILIFLIIVCMVLIMFFIYYCSIKGKYIEELYIPVDDYLNIYEICGFDYDNCHVTFSHSFDDNDYYFDLHSNKNNKVYDNSIYVNGYDYQPKKHDRLKEIYIINDEYLCMVFDNGDDWFDIFLFNKDMEYVDNIYGWLYYGIYDDAITILKTSSSDEYNVIKLK